MNIIIDMRKTLAIDIGGTNTRLAVVNESFQIEQCVIKPTVCNDKEKFMQNIIDGIHELNLEGVEAIGAGVPGVVDREKGIILNLPNVHVENINFAEILKKETGLKTYLRNDAEVACLAEAYAPNAKKFSRIFFITISTGLGGALCIDKKIQDYVTEVGHTVANFGDFYEEFSIVAGSRFPIFAKHLKEPDLTPKTMFEKTRKKDKKYQQFTVKWLQILNQFIRLMINSYEPELVVVTGGFMNDKDVFFKQIKKAHRDVKIKETYFGTNSGLIGAGLYALKGVENE